MTSHEVFERVVDVLRAECPKLEGVGPIARDSRLQADLRLDSADAIAVIAGLEDAFGLRLEDDDVADVETVGDVVQYIVARLAHGPRGDEAWCGAER